MPNITISGSLFDIANKLGRMKQVITYRVNVGYLPKQHDEEWLYQTFQDLNVCPDCAPLHGNLYRGDYIMNDFPFYVSETVTEVKVHNATNFHAAERCRCTAEWLNMHEVLVERLALEMENA